MRFKVDENLHAEIASLLAQHGYDAHTVVEENLRGCADDRLEQPVWLKNACC